MVLRGKIACTFLGRIERNIKNFSVAEYRSILYTMAN